MNITRVCTVDMSKYIYIYVNKTHSDIQMVICEKPDLVKQLVKYAIFIINMTFFFEKIDQYFSDF